jgi:hypothetical protein
MLLMRNTSSVGDVLQHLKWRSLEDRRRDARLVMMYKISHDKVAFVCLFFNGGGTDVQVATQEAKSLIGFTTDVVDVAFPFEVMSTSGLLIFSFTRLFII